MKRVSFEVAKAIKKAGYQQGITEKVYLLKDYAKMKEGWVIFKEKCMYTDFLADIPTYIQVWLWLWREKHLALEVYVTSYDKWVSPIDVCLKYDEYPDPEEAIATSIEYLVTNNLIK